jgi:hypothetical protein
MNEILREKRKNEIMRMEEEKEEKGKTRIDLRFSFMLLFIPPPGI